MLASLVLDVKYCYNRRRRRRINSNVKSRNSKNANKNTSQIYMRLPYINETIVRRVNGILRSSKAPIKPVWINKNSLQKRLVSSALIQPPCPSGNKKCHTCEHGWRMPYGRCGRCHTNFARATPTFCPFISIGHSNFDLLVNHIMFWPHQL